jgi:hypothetical protein
MSCLLHTSKSHALHSNGCIVNKCLCVRKRGGERENLKSYDILGFKYMKVKINFHYQHYINSIYFTLTLLEHIIVLRELYAFVLKLPPVFWK